MAAIWFITGVSSGFGTEIALKALEAGLRVIGTVRHRAKAAHRVSAIEEKGGKILELDVTDASACLAVIKKAESMYGHIDVLVNNAGVALLGAVEDIEDEEARNQMETNFYGPHRLIRAALPGFRAHKSGTIVNITSVAGIDGLPAAGLYAGSKFALEGIAYSLRNPFQSDILLTPIISLPLGYSESLARETADFNISILIVEPGAFRTNFLSAFMSAKNQGHHYPAAQAVIDRFAVMDGKQAGDPAKAAVRIVEAVTGGGMMGHPQGRALRMPLGSDCVGRYEAKIKAMSEDLERVREVAMSTNLA